MYEQAAAERDYAWAGTATRAERRESPYGEPEPKRMRKAAASWVGERQTGSRRADDRRPTGRGIGALLALAALIVALAGIGLLAASPLAAVRSVDISGGSSLSRDELLSLAGIGEATNWLAFDAAQAAERLVSHPRIAQASVRKGFFGALSIELAEREPVALVYARGASGRQEAHCVDAEGVVFAPLSARPAARELPVISGIEIRGLRYGMRLGDGMKPLLASLAALASSSPELLKAVSEIRLVAKDGSPAEAILYPANYRVPVRIKPALSAELLKTMLLVMDVMYAGGIAPSVAELDLRSDVYVYKLKEAVSG
jgi:cell division protein FtsQ